MALTTTMGAQTAPQLNAHNIDEILRAMTLEEKAQLLVGDGNTGFVGSGAMLGHQSRRVAGAAGQTVAIQRLGIPATVLTDGPAGVHIDPIRKGTAATFYATGFPVGTCLASTWNPQLVYQVGQAIGNETLEYGCDVVLGPGLNIQRNPLGGRNFEYYSEDPLVTGVIGSAMVRGIQSQGVGTSPKHFAVNSQEGDRVRVDERVPQRALREIYLRGFERVVREAQPWTLMSSYNKINGVYAQGNRDLLTTILRKEWGGRCIVMTDWIGKRKDLPTGQMVAAGNDLFMPGYPAQVQDIIDGVKNGSIKMEDVDRNVRNMLEFIVKTPSFRHYKFSNKPDMKAHAAITRQASAEGMVLLKNDHATLPVRGLKTVALFGVNSYDFFSGGLGSGCVNVPYVIDMVQGLKNVGVTTTPTLTDIYTKYVSYASAKFKADKNPEMWFYDQGQPKLDEIDITDRLIAHEEPLADAAIITIARQAGEGMDRSVSEFNLSDKERDMIFRVSDHFHAAGKPVIVVINSGTSMETVSWRDRVDAILVAWQPGEEGGNSVADVLTGKVNPSGHLTATWPVSVSDDPSTKNFPQDPVYYNLTDKFEGGYLKGVNFSNHEEGIYVGYRYYDTFHRQVAYPFGYGMSYTTFAFSNLSAKKSGNNVVVSVTVKNMGNTEGKQVAQIYVAAPKGGLEKPAKELKAFAKTKLLKPGQSETLTMTIPMRDLASYDEAGSQWIVEPGTYHFLVGDNVESIKEETMLQLDSYTEKTNNVLVMKEKLNLLHQ
jgi:beta-glucosidase